MNIKEKIEELNLELEEQRSDLRYILENFGSCTMGMSCGDLSGQNGESIRREIRNTLEKIELLESLCE